MERRSLLHSTQSIMPKKESELMELCWEYVQYLVMPNLRSAVLRVSELAAIPTVTLTLTVIWSPMATELQLHRITHTFSSRWVDYTIPGTPAKLRRRLSPDSWPTVRRKPVLVFRLLQWVVVWVQAKPQTLKLTYIAYTETSNWQILTHYTMTVVHIGTFPLSPQK